MDMNKIKQELSKSGSWSARDFTLWARPTIKALVKYVENLQYEVGVLESQLANANKLIRTDDTEVVASEEPEPEVGNWNWNEDNLPTNEEKTDD